MTISEITNNVPTTLMDTLGMDIETFSKTDLLKSGLYKYVNDPDFEVLLFAYKFNDEEIQIVDLKSGEDIPDSVMDALIDPNVIKTAFNAAFEIACLSKHFGYPLDRSQWSCTMILAAMLGLPLSLDRVGSVLHLNTTKDKIGKSLIKYFTMPVRATKVNGMRTRNMPNDDIIKWMQFKDYCVTDVIVEQGVRNKLKFFQVPTREMEFWILDQEINARGVMVNKQLVQNAIKIDNLNKERLLTRAVEITGLQNPNSVKQLKAWLEEETGELIDSLQKSVLPELRDLAASDTVKEMITIRQELSKTSIKKYQAILNYMDQDHRTRGLFQFYGANRTARWAGRGVQLQNLRRNYLKDLDVARQIVLDGDYELLLMMYGNVSEVLSQLIRTAFIPKHGYKLVISDFSAIEARVVAWLANEKWRLEVFRTHGKIYEASGSQMFRVPIEQVTKGSVLRDKAKIAELALGYGGSVGALERMGAAEMGMNLDELQGLVNLWREANPMIKALWSELNGAALAAVVEPGLLVKTVKWITMQVKHNVLFVKLPSGRYMSYMRPKIIEGKFGPSVQYEGLDQVKGIWVKIDTYGGKLAENITQAISRDLLAEKLLLIDQHGYECVIHVHDEGVFEVPEEVPAELIDELMGQDVSWAPGLPLGADTHEKYYYQKD